MKTIIIYLLIVLMGCKPGTQPAGASNNAPELTESYYSTEDGVRLPVHHWLPRSGTPRAIVIGIHGFNDYGNFLKQAAEYFSSQSIATYTYDQRGFGAAPEHGYWAGSETYAADLRGFVRAVKRQHPDIPLYVLGESMGGAVLITAVRDGHFSKIDGIILVAPALWSRSEMPWYQTALLWVLAHTVPWITLSGEDVGAKLSDNREMMRELDNDSLVIRKTRIEALYGLTDLMDSAFESADQLGGKILLVYGDKDDIIPKHAISAFLKGLYSSGDGGKTVGYYHNGYHLLLRDLEARVVWQDITHWVLAHGNGPLPSRADDRANQELLTPLQVGQQANID